MKIVTILLPLFILLFSCQNFKNDSELEQISIKFQNGEMEAAKSELKDFLSKTKNNVAAWTIMGHIHSELEEDSLAVKSYKQALLLDSKYVQAITGQGIIARKRGQYKKAARLYSKAINIDPNYAEAYASLLVIKIQQGDYDEAVAVGQRGYQLDDSDPIIASNLTLAYHYQQDTMNRNKFFEITKKNNYKNIQILEDIITGTREIHFD